MDESNSKKKEAGVKSNVLGVVYTDLVCYILPGAFFLLGLLIVFECGCAALKLLKMPEASSGFAMVLILSVAAMSYPAGVLLSFIRWFFYEPLEDYCNTISFGRLIYGDISGFTLRRVGLPKPVRVQALNRITDDLKRLKWFEPNQETSSAGGEAKKPSKELIDSLWHLMVGTLRESGSVFFLHYDRWDDIDVARKNILITVQTLTLVWAVRRIILFPITWWWTVPIASILLGVSVLIYLFVLPLIRYKHMRWLLLSYLSGRLRVSEDEK